MSINNERGHRPRKGAPLSQTPRAIKARESRAALRADKKATTLGQGEAPGGEYDRSEIGVIDESPMPADTPMEAPHTYICVNCGERLDYGAPLCGICEEPLNWAGVQ